MVAHIDGGTYAEGVWELRRISEYKRNEVKEERRKLHNEELNYMYSLPKIVRVMKTRRMRWSGHVARREEGTGVYRLLVGKPEGKNPAGRPRSRWEDNIKMYLQEVGFEGMDWIVLAQDMDKWLALVNAVTKLRFP